MKKRMRTVAAVALLATGAAPEARAQLATKKALTLEGARKAIAAAVAEARKSNATGVIAVVDDGGNLMALERIDGTFASWYEPGRAVTGSVWDALAAPILLLPRARRSRVLILGLGGGSAARIVRPFTLHAPWRRFPPRGAARSRSATAAHRPGSGG